MNDTALAKVEAGTIQRQEFGADQLARPAETAGTAMAAQAEAEVKARYIVALQRPRNEFDARNKMLRDCERPAFAQAAIYRKPVGGGKAVEGLSIRFAESAARAWKNLHTSISVISDDFEKRLARVTVTDLEANVSESVDVVVEKTVERKFLKDGQVAIRSRINSYGDLVHLVPAEEGAFLTKQAAEVAKAKRQCILHLIPRDIQEDAMKKAYAVQANEDARDPDAAKKTMFDSYAQIGVKPSDIESYLSHSVDSVSPAEILELRAVFGAVRDGETTWNDALQAKLGIQVDGKQDPKMQAVKDQISKRVAAARKKDQPAAKATDPAGREPGSDG